jgi:hypothetical protein
MPYLPSMIHLMKCAVHIAGVPKGDGVPIVPPIGPFGKEALHGHCGKGFVPMGPNVAGGVHGDLLSLGESIIEQWAAEKELNVRVA